MANELNIYGSGQYWNASSAAEAEYIRRLREQESYRMQQMLNALAPSQMVVQDAYRAGILSAPLAGTRNKKLLLLTKP